MFASREQLPGKTILHYPKLSYHDLTEQDKFDLQWYVVGKPSDFLTNKPYKCRVWNKNYVVWRNEDYELRALDDVCTHKGASLSGGKIINDQVMCPYHGYEFNCNGTLTKVPGICFQPSPIYNLAKYPIVEYDGWIYLNTYEPSVNTSFVKIENPKNSTELSTQFVADDIIDTTLYLSNADHPANIQNSPEQNCSVVYLDMEYNCYSRVLSENSLDVMHIAFVHTFGNAKRPNPTKEDPPKLIGKNHYKSTYYYEAGEDSMARKMFGVKDLIIENEFILPHTTVARVKFGDQISAVVTFALPIGDNKSKLFVKTYRNFWQNQVGDIITRNTMLNTMLQDKVVVENIDPRFMDGKFNMRFDKLQNTYKSFYKKFIDNGEN
jgi:phenylpropionate dioxygenase-like ring-hydroxylating dioxygenase large terminal subunit